jgi:hypothetical protein
LLQPAKSEEPSRECRQHTDRNRDHDDDSRPRGIEERRISRTEADGARIEGRRGSDLHDHERSDDR